MTLIEMLSAILIMSFVGAAITELCASQNIVAFRTIGKLDGIVNARRAMAQLDKDIRQASSFPTSYVPTGLPPGDNGVAVWPAPTPNYQADYQTFILQEPSFDANGYLTASYKTIVYKILADKRSPGKGLFVLQKKVFAGPTDPQDNSDPQTLLTGIVGPINPADTVDSTALTPAPKVFRPLIKLAELYASSGIPDLLYPPSALPSSLTKGIKVSLEVHDSASEQKSATPKSIAFSREIYARGNYAALP